MSVSYLISATNLVLFSSLLLIASPAPTGRQGTLAPSFPPPPLIHSPATNHPSTSSLPVITGFSPSSKASPTSVNPPFPPILRKRTRKEKSAPLIDLPPSESEVQKLTLTQFVKLKARSFNTKDSKPWIEAFGKHPKIKSLEGESFKLSSDQYAFKFYRLLEATSEGKVGKRITQALKGHMKAKGYDEQFQKHVLMRLQYLRESKSSRGWHKNKRESMGEEEYKAYRRTYKASLKKEKQKADSQEEVLNQVIDFSRRMKDAGIESEGLDAKQLEVQTRELHVKYYTGDKRKASQDMVAYMKSRSMPMSDIVAAKLARRFYNRAGTLKAWKARKRQAGKSELLVADEEGHGGSSPRTMPTSEEHPHHSTSSRATASLHVSQPASATSAAASEQGRAAHHGNNAFSRQLYPKHGGSTLLQDILATHHSEPEKSITSVFSFGPFLSTARFKETMISTQNSKATGPLLHADRGQHSGHRSNDHDHIHPSSLSNLDGWGQHSQKQSDKTDRISSTVDDDEAWKEVLAIFNDEGSPQQDQHQKA